MKIKFDNKEDMKEYLDQMDPYHCEDIVSDWEELFIMYNLVRCTVMADVDKKIEDREMSGRDVVTQLKINKSIKASHRGLRCNKNRGYIKKLKFNKKRR